MSQGSSDSPRPPKRPRAQPANEPTPQVGDSVEREARAGSTFRANPSPKRKRSTSAYDDLGEAALGEESIQSDEQPTPQPIRVRSGKSGKRKSSTEQTMPGWSKLGEAMLIGRVNAGELAVFCRQFGVYLDSGVGILKALSSLRKQVAGSAMGPVTERIGASIKRGESLTEAAAREPHAFDAMAISMFRVAEARGGLPETLKRLASHYDARQRFWRQARSAMIYPTAVVIVALAVGGFLTIFVLPTLVSILEDTVRGKGVDLPGPTKLLIGITKLVQSAGWWLIPLLLVLGIFGVRQGYRSKKTKRWFDEVIIRLPGVGGLVRLIDHGRFTRTLSDLLEAGVDIDSSLRLSADVLQFEPYRKAVLDARGAVRQGAELTPSLRNTRQFSPDLLAFAETGEETGQLPESLAKIAADYEERAELLIKNIGSVIQPLLMIVIGGMVGFVVVAFLMAYVAVLTSLMGGH